MKKFITTMALLALTAMFSQSMANATALFYTDATYPVTATGVKVENLHNLKKGTASSSNVLYLIETGDAGIEQAAKNGNIKKITYIDVNEKTVFIFWRKITVTVYGE